MTIAACYLSSEGVVFGADSTSTMFIPCPDGRPGGVHHLNYAQKVFEIGDKSTLGITMWGMGAIGDLAHRTLIARFADEIVSSPVGTMSQVANEFSRMFWEVYSEKLRSSLDRYRQLQSTEDSLSRDEKAHMEALHQALSGGYCIGGHLTTERQPSAFEISYSPQLAQPPTPSLLNHGAAYFWGCPNIIHRVLYGIDEALFSAILNSGKWTGSRNDLFDLILDHRIAQPFDLPLREAIDWVNSVIYTTIKAMKFSHYSPVCGGPIEIAVISSDRTFRWVQHKRFDHAL